MADLDWQRRYARHLILPHFGEAKQQRFARARVLIIGAGGLGSASATYLAAAGVGTLGIVDDDRVDLSNLHRQILHEQADIGRAKTDSARDRLHELNPDCRIELYPLRLSEQNAAEIIAPYDLVLDGCDNFATRLAVNAACFASQTPLISAAAIGWQGQLMRFTYAANTPCYACLISHTPPDADSCTENGIISPLCGIIGSMQALEAIKHITHTHPMQAGAWLRYDGLQQRVLIGQIVPDPACGCCGKDTPGG